MIALAAIVSFLQNWWKVAAAVAVVATLMTFGWKVKNYISEAEAAKAAVPVLEEKLTEARANARTNQESFETCSATNLANQREAEAQRIRAMLANARAEELEATAANDVEETSRESEAFSDRELGCPALDRDFRQWLLRDP